MDIKLKNIKYTTGAKVIAVILIWLSFMCTAACGISLIFFEDSLSIVSQNEYFDTYHFKNDYADLVHNVVEGYVVLKSEKNIKAPIIKDLTNSNHPKVSAEPEITSSKKVDAQDSAAVPEEIPVENAITVHEEITAENSADYENELDVIKESIVKKLDRFRRIQQHLSDHVNFIYYIHNTETQDVITNVTAPNALDLIQSQSTTKYFNHWEAGPNFPYGNDIRKMLSDTSYEVYTAVLNDLQPGDSFYDNNIAFNKYKALLPYLYTALVISFIVLITAFIYLVYVSGRKEKNGSIHLSFVDRTYTDIHFLLVLIAAAFSLAILNAIYNDIIWNDGDKTFLMSCILFVLGIDACIGLNYIFSMIRQMKNKQIITNSLLYKIWLWIMALIKVIIGHKMFKPWIIVSLLAYSIINGILIGIMLAWDGFFTFMILIIFNVLSLYFISKFLVSLTKIMTAVKEISTGNLDYPLQDSKISMVFSALVTDVQNIQSGLKKAVKEAVKSERMKTDLIANVSHDLKTPLTSLITYIDLLKNEDLNNDIADDYIRILEEKSYRLKQLIEDLIEASKASSGNLILQKEKIELHELIMQACGEYEEKLAESGLDIRINKSENSIFVNADGRYMWRIVENIFSNVIKYSLSNTRVYIDITQTSTQGLLTIKNISSCPLDVSPDQLTERFVRGEESRTTEGSGLGLSIAQSLTHLQDGNFEIEIDGDLFKTIIAIPRWEK